MSDPMWLVVYCTRDDSFCLIKETEAVFDKEHLSTGDNVKFFYDNETWDGEVRCIGGDDDYDELKKRLIELNAERKLKRDSSFNENKPRKTRGKGGKYQQALEMLKPRATKRNADKDPKPVVKKAVSKKGNDESHKSRPLAKLLEAAKNDNDDSSSSESSSGSDTEQMETSPCSSPLPEEDAGISRKAEQREKRLTGARDDMTILKSLKETDLSDGKGNKTANNVSKTDDTMAISLNSSDKLVISESPDRIPAASANKSGGGSSKKLSTSTKVTEETTKSPTAVKRPSIIKAAGSTFNPFDSEDSEEDSSKQVKENNDVKRRKKSSDTKEGKVTSNVMASNEERQSLLKWKEGDEDVVLVQGRSKDLSEKKFFVSSTDLHTAKQKENASTFARSLLVAAFTNEALFTHTISGGQYRAAGKEHITQKPALPSDVVAVIIDVALHRQSSKKWSPTQTKKDLMTGLRQKLVDMRPQLKKILNK
ncbi:Putative BEN domain-containing protein B1 [Frankliniella fusca]|uniref:BEN domain-containing protein B1 n=1 Tax=Frankliniella fusca TaxID=407009 RepID=A0AAE1HAG2_9NEOP|nr:Putative BEN domain-containing protein B1 [Frankliniella fusca]KAK3925204.1 Putative BEN domain-containing protein B1 [Frankliniella fusca]